MRTSSIKSATVEAWCLEGASDLLQLLVIQLKEVLPLLFRQLVVTCGLMV